MDFVTLILLATLLAVLIFAIRQVIHWILWKETFQVKPNGGRTPGDLGLPFETLNIQSGSAQLQAWFVEAIPSSDRPQAAVLVFHGTGESISDWIGAQKYLYDQGVSSMVIDYAGFGNSTGRPSFEQVRRDILAAQAAFLARIGDKGVPFLFGFSLGAEAILDVAEQIDPAIRGVILVGALASVRILAADRRMVPGGLSFLLPDVFNNVRAIRKVRQPLLITHSESDEVIPFSHAEMLLGQSRRELVRLIALNDLKHNDIWQQPSDAYWFPILQFVKEFCQPYPLKEQEFVS